MEAGQNKIIKLSRTVASLQEFIQANVAVVPNPSPNVPLPSAVPEETLADNTTQREGESGTAHDEGFTIVEEGAKPVRRAMYPAHCFNTFAILEEEDEQESTSLVGHVGL